MNQLNIIGNLTRDPETRATNTGKTVCSFTVAVGKDEKAQFFRVAAWNNLGESCQKYLSKGRKVAVTGPVSIRTWDKDGKTYASLEVMANSVEFLSQKQDTAGTPDNHSAPDNDGLFNVNEDDIPF